MESESHLLTQILILLGASTVLITLFYRMKIAPLLAFLLVGIVMGPGDLKIVEIHREQDVFIEDSLNDFVFQRGDVIILNGHLDQMSLGESYLLLSR